jgi:hypothetical protein
LNRHINFSEKKLFQIFHFLGLATKQKNQIAGGKTIKSDELYFHPEHAHQSYFAGGCRPYTRWWWLAGPFTKQDIEYQLEWLKKSGFGGVEIAWILPLWNDLDEYTPEIEWLGKEWIELTRFTKEYADSIGLGCDFTFGSCWPFGGNHVKRKDASQTFSGVSKRRLDSSWESMDNLPYIVNHLSQKALRNYAVRLIDAFAPALSGNSSALFCDSLELDTSGIWSAELWDEFAAEYGYRLEDLVDKFEQFPGAQYDYWKLISKVMLREFFRTFTDICHRAGAQSRVQCHGAPVDLLAAYASVDVPESEALLFPIEFSRIAASAAALSGKPVVTCETFTCIYGFVHRGDSTPLKYWKKESVRDLKLLADGLFAQGVNQIIWHGMPFNGPHGKNEFYASVHVGPDASFAQDLPCFNQYLEHISGVLRSGKPISDMAIYMPIEDARLLGQIPLEKRTPAYRYYWEMRHIRVPDEIAGYAPLWISNEFLSNATIHEKRLIVGDCSFALLYIDCKYLDQDALRSILNLARQGLPVICKQEFSNPGHQTASHYIKMKNELLSLKNVSSTVDEISCKPFVSGHDIPWFWCRKTSGHMIFFFAHPATKNIKYPMQHDFHLDQTERRMIDIKMDEIEKTVELIFKPYHSLMLRIDRRTNEIEWIQLPNPYK